MGRGRRPNIPIGDKKDIMEFITGNRDINIIEVINMIVDKTRKYGNITQTFQLLAEVSSLPCVKESIIKNMSNLNFPEDARNLVGSLTQIYIYQDADAYSLLLYVMWGRLLTNNGTIDDYEIKYNNHRFELNCTYNQGTKIRLGTDAISQNSIEKYKLSEVTYRLLGSFLILPISGRGGLNSKKALLGENIKDFLDKIKMYYENDDKSFITKKYDQDWLNYLGGDDKQKAYNNFCKRLLLTNTEFDTNGIFTVGYIKNRNTSMYEIIENNSKRSNR